MTGSDRESPLGHKPKRRLGSTTSQTDSKSQLNRSFSAEDNRIASQILDDVKKMSLGERFAQQKKTRVKYDQLLHFIKDAGERMATGEKSDLLDDKLVNNLEETSEDLKLLSSGKEVALDACYMVENVHLMREQVKMLQENQADKRLNVKIFAEKMITYAKKIATPTLPKHNVNPLLILDDDDEDEEELPLLKGRLTSSKLTRRQWASISHNYELVRNVVGIGYLRPLLTNAELQPTIAKKKKEKMDKQVAQRQKKEAAVILEQKEKGENMGEDQSVTIELDFIRKTFHRLLKKTGSTFCNYYEFIFDPDDFGRTVENMFHVSFLLRDASMLLRKDATTDLPILVWVSPEEQMKIQENAKKEPLHQQTIFAFTQQHWKELKNRLPIQRAIIKPLEQRQRDGGGPRSGEKRHHDETTEKKLTKEKLKTCHSEGSRSTDNAKKTRHEE